MVTVLDSVNDGLPPESAVCCHRNLTDAQLRKRKLGLAQASLHQRTCCLRLQRVLNPTVVNQPCREGENDSQSVTDQCSGASLECEHGSTRQTEIDCQPKQHVPPTRCPRSGRRIEGVLIPAKQVFLSNFVVQGHGAGPAERPAQPRRAAGSEEADPPPASAAAHCWARSWLKPPLLNPVGKKPRGVLVRPHAVRIANTLDLSALLRFGVSLHDPRPVPVKAPEQFSHFISLLHFVCNPAQRSA